jgi:hypothetical protein
MRYAAYVRSAGGLTAFVEAAAGRRAAWLQGAVWIVSYLLYILYTTVQVVYDLLPAVAPLSGTAQTVLALAIPVAITGVMVAGTRPALLVAGLVGAAQVVLGGVLDGVTVTHLTTPLSSFGTSAGVGEIARGGVQTSLLYVCASLPLFLGGEVGRSGPALRLPIVAAAAVTGVLVLLAVAPLAAAPGLTRTAVPGVSVLSQYAGSGLARVVGLGVAVSVAGVILAEYLALTRLLHALAGWSRRTATLAVGAVAVIAAPVSLIDPDGFYDALARPSLVALWVSQLVVFVVYPRFAIRRGARPAPAWALGLAATAWAAYGVYNALAHVTS